MISHLLALYLLVALFFTAVIVWQDGDRDVYAGGYMMAALVGLLWPFWLALWLIGVAFALVEEALR